jgi:hypothetical protein
LRHPVYRASHKILEKNLDKVPRSTEEKVYIRDNKFRCPPMLGIKKTPNSVNRYIYRVNEEILTEKRYGLQVTSTTWSYQRFFGKKNTK